MVASIARVTSFGAVAPGTSTAPITTSAGTDLFSHRAAGRKARLDAALEEIVDGAEPWQGPIDDDHVGADADRHPRRLGTDNAAADDHDLADRNAGNAAQQDAAAAVRLLQRGSRRLDRQPAGDLAHRGKERQAAIDVGHGLVGNRGDARSQADPRPARDRRQGGDR